MALRFAIIYQGKTDKGQKMVKTMMTWPEKKVLEVIKKHFGVTHDIDKALRSAISEFKKESVKIL